MNLTRRGRVPSSKWSAAIQIIAPAVRRLRYFALVFALALWYNVLMMNLIFAVVASSYIACTNCLGVGSVDLVCPDCKGKGLVKVEVVGRVSSVKFLNKKKPCPKCSKGLTSDKGSGKIRRWCPCCKGQKKIKKPVAISPDK